MTPLTEIAGRLRALTIIQDYDDYVMAVWRAHPNSLPFEVKKEDIVYRDGKGTTHSDFLDNGNPSSGRHTDT